MTTSTTVATTTARLCARPRPSTAQARRITTPRPSFDQATPDADAWRGRAACRTADPDLFFPDQGDYVTTRAAVAVCHGCPVVDACLADAVAMGERYGIRGGLTAVQRRASRRPARVHTHAAAASQPAAARRP